MSHEVTLNLTTFDRTRKAEVTLPRTLTGRDLVEASKDNWQLPRDTDYQLMNSTKSLQVPLAQSLTEKYVSDGDLLTIQPLLVAGGVADDRRRADERHLEDLCRRSQGRVSIRSRSGSPPHRYVLEFRLRSVESADAQGRPRFREAHQVEVTLPARYPLEPPEARLMTPLHHPHVYPGGKVCIGFHHLPTEFLDRFVERLSRILVFDPAYIDFKSPANGAAMQWVRQVWDQGLLPTDQGLAPEAVRFTDRSAIKWT